MFWKGSGRVVDLEQRVRACMMSSESSDSPTFQNRPILACTALKHDNGDNGYIDISSIVESGTVAQVRCDVPKAVTLIVVVHIANH